MIDPFQIVSTRLAAASALKLAAGCPATVEPTVSGAVRANVAGAPNVPLNPASGLMSSAACTGEIPPCGCSLSYWVM